MKNTCKNAEEIKHKYTELMELITDNIKIIATNNNDDNIRLLVYEVEELARHRTVVYNALSQALK